MTINILHRLTAGLIAVSAAVALCCAAADAQQVKRLVIVKVDGLPSYFVDDVVKRRDPNTSKSMLPWIEEVFYRNGTRVPNFYTRGMSLSGPSWSMLDTGQHLAIKGNVEFDRYTLRSYDYLNLAPFYYGYTFGNTVDSVGVQVLDGVGVPLLSDVFPADKKYASQQLYQRGWAWGIFGGAFMNMIPHKSNDLLDEWTIGFDTHMMTMRQNERDVAEKLVKHPSMDYFDYFDPAFDHVSHHNNDETSRINVLKDLDHTIGHIWNAIQDSPRANETAMVLVSDHGFNSTSHAYSQGFNLVNLLTSPTGGAHHVVTKRFLMMQYAIRSLNPTSPLVHTSSEDSYYLKGQAGKYPTALLDFDGNERSSLHLRNSDLNLLHILLLELKKNDLHPPLRDVTTEAVLSVIDRYRADWQRTISEMDEELGALSRWIAATKPAASRLPTREDKGITKEQALANRRVREQIDLAERDVADYRRYISSLNKLLTVRLDDIIKRKFVIEELIAPNSMGEQNSIGDLQNYIVGLSPQGLELGPDGRLDLDKSFIRVNYFKLLLDQRVRNNVQEGVSNRPIDFLAARVPLTSLRDSLGAELAPNEDPTWLYGGDEKQVLLLTRRDENGASSYRYLAVSNLRQGADGRVTYTVKNPTAGLPLHYFEDPELNVPSSPASWLSAWHTEVEWLRAVHMTRYSNGIIGLNEQMNQHFPNDVSLAGDAALIRRFHVRQRSLAEADLLIEASDHWNFDVRGFNPGGNHGSFLRLSTNATFMIAGGDATGIPKGFVVQEPYDSLSFVPTLMRLIGRIDEHNRPQEDEAKQGYRQFPGPVVKEIFAGH
ncbi:MAG: alkaline phosphatase family protein [Pyrinomonadaceae bacterium]